MLTFCNLNFSTCKYEKFIYTHITETMYYFITDQFNDILAEVFFTTSTTQHQNLTQHPKCKIQNARFKMRLFYNFLLKIGISNKIVTNSVQNNTYTCQKYDFLLIVAQISNYNYLLIIFLNNNNKIYTTVLFQNTFNNYHYQQTPMSKLQPKKKKIQCNQQNIVQYKSTFLKNYKIYSSILQLRTLSDILALHFSTLNPQKLKFYLRIVIELWQAIKHIRNFLYTNRNIVDYLQQ
eukprot:TRINITY_DN27697_c0_g1_i1.p1 TRINITY_DN27697_c0_g1~~TRINITY_DN27697_c0_g1_i1.p1  ORF type:complete len:235 (+),score=-14.41 TRINITY_DN27697_c0_g1_i1:243-947(+)